MPKSKFIWSSWNFFNNNKNDISFSLTYWMNLLQNIKSDKNYFVSINPSETPSKYYDKTIFEHPIFNLETLSELQDDGANRGFDIGRRTNDSQYFPGSINHLRIWNEAIGEDELIEITPLNLRMRKMELDVTKRLSKKKKEKK